MSTHPEIQHLAREERIRAIAYSLWEEEGRPDGRDEAHWLQAERLVDTEASPEPAWLKRETPPAPAAIAPEERLEKLEQLAKRLAGARVA